SSDVCSSDLGRGTRGTRRTRSRGVSPDLNGDLAQAPCPRAHSSTCSSRSAATRGSSSKRCPGRSSRLCPKIHRGVAATAWREVRLLIGLPRSREVSTNPARKVDVNVPWARSCTWVSSRRANAVGPAFGAGSGAVRGTRRIALRSLAPNPRRKRTRNRGSTQVRNASCPVWSRTQVEEEGTSRYTDSVPTAAARATRGTRRSQPPVRFTTACTTSVTGESIQVDRRTVLEPATSRGQDPTSTGTDPAADSPRSSSTWRNTASARSWSRPPRASLALVPWLYTRALSPIAEGLARDRGRSTYRSEAAPMDSAP